MVGAMDADEPPARLLRATQRQQEQMLRESRATGERSVDMALAEVQIISQNVYVQRKPRKLLEEEIPVCECQAPHDPQQLGCQDDCLNRVALIECIPGYCPCGDRCDNQRIQRGNMPPMEIVDCDKKGLGMEARRPIKAGDFVAEYMGEIVTEQEYHLRRLRYHNEKHRYMMVLSGGEVIDATRMGGVARFINHSCDPNCGVEKWDVDGEERCGIFALRDIKSGEELSFDYKFKSFSRLEITKCLCGSKNCRGFIGMNNRVVKQPSRSYTAPGPGQGPRRRLDPIMQKGVSNRRMAESTLDRMVRVLVGQRFFTNRELQFLGTSRVVLRRNFLRLADDNFRSLCLEPHYLNEATGQLDEVSHVFKLRELPRYVPRMANMGLEERQVRLEAILERLRTGQRTSY